MIAPAIQVEVVDQDLINRCGLFYASSNVTTIPAHDAVGNRIVVTGGPSVVGVGSPGVRMMAVGADRGAVEAGDVGAEVGGQGILLFAIPGAQENFRAGQSVGHHTIERPHAGGLGVRRSVPIEVITSGAATSKIVIGIDHSNRVARLELPGIGIVLVR